MAVAIGARYQFEWVCRDASNSASLHENLFPGFSFVVCCEIAQKLPRNKFRANS